MIDCVIDRPLEYRHIGVGRLRSLDFWRLATTQNSNNGNLLMLALLGLLHRWVNWELSNFLCILIFFRFFLVTLVLWWEPSFDNFGRYILLDLAVEALSKREGSHYPAGTPRSTLRPTARGVDSRWGHFFLLGSRSIGYYLLDLFISEVSRRMQDRSVWIQSAGGALESPDSWQLV